MAETKILTDIEMTHTIWNHTKGDGHHKQAIKDLWLEFSEQAYEENELKPPSVFVEAVNRWLREHKIPIKVHDFNLIDEAINGTDWVVEDTA